MRITKAIEILLNFQTDGSDGDLYVHCDEYGSDFRVAEIVSGPARGLIIRPGWTLRRERRIWTPEKLEEVARFITDVTLDERIRKVFNLAKLIDSLDEKERT